MKKSKLILSGNILVVAIGIIIALQLLNVGCTSESKKAEQEQTRSIMVGAGAGLKPALDPVAEAYTAKTAELRTFHYSSVPVCILYGHHPG